MTELLIVGRALALALRSDRPLILETRALCGSGDETQDQPPAPPDVRSTVFDRLGPNLAALAHGGGARAAGYRRADNCR